MVPSFVGRERPSAEKRNLGVAHVTGASGKLVVCGMTSSYYPKSSKVHLILAMQMETVHWK